MAREKLSLSKRVHNAMDMYWCRSLDFFAFGIWFFVSILWGLSWTLSVMLRAASGYALYLPANS